jgi:preprotein translocase subunit SecD
MAAFGATCSSGFRTARGDHRNFSWMKLKTLHFVKFGRLALPINWWSNAYRSTLGATEVRKSVVAGFFGLLMVLVFMIGYYGKLGVIASFALIIYGLISFAIFRAIPVVLTLPGVAGFILSIGMAVDSNILIFERFKRIRRGKVDIAVRLGSPGD